MHMPDLFLARAAECEAMARTAHEPDSKATWARMAQRWHRCAEVELKAHLTAARPNPDRHGNSSPGRSRH